MQLYQELTNDYWIQSMLNPVERPTKYVIEATVKCLGSTTTFNYRLNTSKSGIRIYIAAKQKKRKPEVIDIGNEENDDWLKKADPTYRESERKLYEESKNRILDR